MANLLSEGELITMEQVDELLENKDEPLKNVSNDLEIGNFLDTYSAELNYDELLKNNEEENDKE